MQEIAESKAERIAGVMKGVRQHRYTAGPKATGKFNRGKEQIEEKSDQEIALRLQMRVRRVIVS